MHCPFLDSSNLGMNHAFNYGHNTDSESSDPAVIKISKWMGIYFSSWQAVLGKQEGKVIIGIYHRI